MSKHYTTPIKTDNARAHLISSAVAMEFSVSAAALRSQQKGSNEVSYARQVAMYLMQSSFNAPHARIAVVFGRHPSTVSHACKTIEAQRDDPVLDRKLISLENFLAQAPRSDQSSASPSQEVCA